FSDPTPKVGTEAATVGLLAPVMQERIDRAGLRDLLADVELPLSAVLARIQAAGVRIDVEYLNEMSESLGDRMRTLEEDIYRPAGSPASAPTCRTSRYAARSGGRSGRRSSPAPPIGCCWWPTTRRSSSG